MQQGANPVTMDSIKQGQFCGACHNGKAAFGADFQNCARCHREPDE
jgi:c(7)-type cytochrome triheme protein